MTVDRRSAVVGAVVLALFVVVLIAVSARWGPLDRGDAWIARHANRYADRHATIVTAAKTISSVGSPIVLEIVGVVAGLAAAIRRRLPIAAGIVIVVAAQYVLGHFLKVWVDRGRPAVAHPVAHAGGPSFPSSHALASASIIGALVVAAWPYLAKAATRWVVAITAAVLVLAIGLSRIILSVHYPSDVAAAWLLAATIVCATRAVKRRPPRLT